MDLYFDISLFNRCNLRCKFCFVDPNDKYATVEGVHSTTETVVDKIKEVVNGSKIKYENIILTTWGGELFSDDIEEPLFNSYYHYVNRIKTVCSELGIIPHFIFTSNGVFTNRNRVEEFIDKTESKLTWSYDSEGRFHNDAQKDLFIENIKYFKDKTLLLGITGTKPCMRSLMQGDKWFQQIIDLNIPIYFNYYWATKNWEQFLPSEDDLLEFFKWCYHNCPTLMPIIKAKNIVKGIKETSICLGATTWQYIGHKFSTDCVRKISCLDPVLFYEEDNEETLKHPENIHAIETKRFQRLKKCLLCKYYTNCMGCCFGSMLFRYFKHSEKCMLAQLYDYIKEQESENR